MIRLASKALLAVCASWALMPAATPVFGQEDARPHFTRDFEVLESARFATIEVARGPAATGMTVNYLTEDFEAKAGSDYEPRVGALTFGPEASILSFQVPIVDDPAEEDDESLSLLLRDSSGKTIDFSELVIISDEAEPEQQAPARGEAPGGEVPPAASGNNAASKGAHAAGSSPGSSGGAAPATPGAEELPVIVLTAKEKDGDRAHSPKRSSASGAEIIEDKEEMPVATMALAAGAVGLAALGLGYLFTVRK